MRLNLLFCLSLFAFLGCGEAGPGLAPVRGTLTQGGKALPGVSVTFSPVESGASSGARTDANGKFVLLAASGKAGAVVGKHKVILTVPADASTAVIDMSNPASRDAMMQQRGSMGEQGRPVEAEVKLSFPPEYADPVKTPLEYTVQDGDNDFDIPIP